MASACGGAGVRMAACAGAIAVLAGGYAAMPTSGPVQPVAVVQRGSGQTQDNPQPIPVPPGRGWSPHDIVSGFLAASTSFANNHAVARAYLAPALARKWNPGWAATVVGPAPKITGVIRPKNVVPGGPQTKIVQFVGQRLATLTSSGQYLTSSGLKEADQFTLVNISGQWRISHLPSQTSLILTEPDFLRDYQPRNLYFFSPSNAGLVPDPVFVPQQATNAEPARGLVKALLKDPSGWLSGATKTDFPVGTKLLGVKILGTSAVVDLGGSAAKASPAVLRNIAAQLVWTLTGTSYSTPGIESVVLEINGLVKRPHGEQLQLLPTYSNLMPARSADGAYFLSAGGGVKELSDSARFTRPVPWPAALSKMAFSAIAVAPGGNQIAGIVPAAKGCTVYSGALRPGATLTPRQLNSGTCTSLSWDNQGDIWAAAGTHVWMLPPQGAAVPVFLPAAAGLASLASPQEITALRIAPDGVRVAMIVRLANGSAGVVLGAISRSGGGSNEQIYIGQSGDVVSIGTDVPDPVALSWYDADHVLVLGQRPIGSQLYDVSLTGGVSTSIATASGTVSITGGRYPLIASTSHGQILASSGPGLPWRLVGLGGSPAYPG